MIENVRMISPAQNGTRSRSRAFARACELTDLADGSAVRALLDFEDRLPYTLSVALPLPDEFTSALFRHDGLRRALELVVDERPALASAAARAIAAAFEAADQGERVDLVRRLAERLPEPAIADRWADKQQGATTASWQRHLVTALAGWDAKARLLADLKARRAIVELVRTLANDAQAEAAT